MDNQHLFVLVFVLKSVFASSEINLCEDSGAYDSVIMELWDLQFSNLGLRGLRFNNHGAPGLTIQ